VKKNIVGFLFCLCLFFISGCITFDSIESARFRDNQYAPTDASKIEVFSTSFPKKEYIGLAVITLSSGRGLEKVKAEAAKLGADAIIIVGAARTRTHSTSKTSNSNNSSLLFRLVADDTTFTTTEEGRQCVAIKFK
jgi:hypothetical protein